MGWKEKIGKGIRRRRQIKVGRSFYDFKGFLEERA